MPHTIIDRINLDAGLHLANQVDLYLIQHDAKHSFARHGTCSENDPTQLGITLDDFANITQTIIHADKIRLSKGASQGVRAKSIEFFKACEADHHLFLRWQPVTSIKNKRPEQLHLKTYFIKKGSQ